MPKLDRTMTLPGDYFHHRATYHLPPSLYYAIETCFQKLFTFINRKQKGWQIRQQLIDLSGGSYHQQFITKSNVFMDALAQPEVNLKPAIERFTTEPPVTELQARYFAAVASGRVNLPERAKMESIIAQDAEKTAKLKPLVVQLTVISFTVYSSC